MAAVLKKKINQKLPLKISLGMKSPLCLSGSFCISLVLKTLFSTSSCLLSVVCNISYAFWFSYEKVSIYVEITNQSKHSFFFFLPAWQTSPVIFRSPTCATFYDSRCSGTTCIPMFCFCLFDFVLNSVSGSVPLWET